MTTVGVLLGCLRVQGSRACTHQVLELGPLGGLGGFGERLDPVPARGGVPLLIGMNA
jgi:hypothetical protein